MALQCVNVVFSNIWCFFCGEFFIQFLMWKALDVVVLSSQKARQQNLSNANSAPADLRGMCGSSGYEELLGNVSLSCSSCCENLCATWAESIPCLVQITSFQSDIAEQRWEAFSAWSQWEVLTLIYLLLLNRKEFFEGCKAINADSIDGICARFPSLLNEAKQEDKFKDLYRFTFQFGLDSEEGQRSLHREIAIALWKLVFTQNKPPILDQWLHFLIENPSGIKGISRDTWNMFLNFTQVIGPDLSNYSEDEAWPSLFDTFVEWEMERRKKEEETKCITSSDTGGLCAEEQT